MNILDQVLQEVREMRTELADLRSKIGAPDRVPHERITISEAAQMLGRSVDTVRDGCKSGRYPGHRDGNRYYFFRDEVQAYLDAKPTTAKSLAERAMEGGKKQHHA